jgi:AcrR family transcriptional regulator
MTANVSHSTKRRIGAASSETRAAIVRATEQVIREEGYAAASTRRVALRAGLKPSLVHYYFPTTDDLLLAVFEQGAAQSDKMMADALASDEPLRALWRYFSDESRTSLAVEYLALAIRRPAIRDKVAAHGEAMRKQQVAFLEKLLGDALSGPDGCPPAGMGVILAGIGRAIFVEGALGVTTGHREASEWVENWLKRLLESKGAID